MSDSNNSSAQKQLPESATHGWNDPPPNLGFSPSTQPKLNLNKRVAFPLANNQQTSSAAPLMSLPTSSAPALATMSPCKIKEADTPSLSSSEIKEETFNAYKDILTEYLEEDRKGAILKRLAALESSWDDKDEVLHKKLHSLAQAFKNKDFKSYDSLHRAIVTDASSKSVTWGPLLKQLIFAIPKDEVEAQPSDNYFVPANP